MTGVIPSLHRPALANYWFNQLATQASFNPTFWQGLTLTTAQKWEALLRPYGPDYKWGSGDETWYNPTDPQAVVTQVAQNIVNFKRRIMLRPLMEDNPDFNGSNPTSRTSIGSGSFWERNANLVANPQGYRWDVDNDGDGVADSVWVDLGLPVRAAKDGKLYKPLFAILCVDMDGRLNLNAHGNLAQANPSPASTYTYSGTATANSGLLFTDGSGGGSAGAINLAWGQGYGPADINLFSLLGSGASSNYSKLLIGNGTYEGRYGSRGLPGIDNIDPLTTNKWFEYGGNYADFTLANNAGSYGSPPDLQGAGAVGLDPMGRPIYANFGVSSSDILYYGGLGTTLANIPYAMNLGSNTSKGLPAALNNPFSVNELERISAAVRSRRGQSACPIGRIDIAQRHSAVFRFRADSEPE